MKKIEEILKNKPQPEFFFMPPPQRQKPIKSNI